MPRPDFWQKIVKMTVKTSFFEVMSEVQKDSEDVFAGLGILKKIKLLNKLSRNLRSKSARSTLTSPGPIRVNGFKLLYLGPEIILTFSAFFWLAVWFSAFSTIIVLFGSWKLQELLNLGSEHKLRRIVSSTSVQDLNWAALAIFRTQIEQIRTHFEQPQIRFRTKWKIWTLFEPQLKKLKCL
jgi:hypothetical protein